MDIACPACATRYVVPDSAIGPDGRVLRCARCRHSWFQDGPEPQTAPLAAVDRNDAEAAVTAEPAPTAYGEAASPPADSYEPATHGTAAPAFDFTGSPSSFAHEPPFRPRRRRATFWIMALILFVLVAAGAVAAMVSFGVPDWLPIPRDHARTPPDLKLDFNPERQQWRPLPNGNSFFSVTGSISNTGRDRVTVPTLEIVLRDARKTAVYTLATASPKVVLAPGESETIDQAIIDAPKSARSADIGWKAP